MSQIMHCLMLLFIVFVIAEIRNVLFYTDTQHPAPLTIWEETQSSPADYGHNSHYRF
ncbi:hypothetical protein [Desulfopila sp. IMCC35006]|uniref:hypothetical protein n=1 Tax=Desulfopila sp. IMCC35006 TaxID=2569542 RepID=UPI001294661F|nr:hypothetical protein [Desulfopila sp. IMCC35006]